jgi:hypothetical protein
MANHANSSPLIVFLVIAVLGFSSELLVLTPSHASAAGPVSVNTTDLPFPLFGQNGAPSSLTPVDPQWAIGAYSNSIGNAVESTSWTNLPAAPNLNGVTSIQFMINVPIDSGGTVTYLGTNYAVQGIIFQCVDYYDAATGTNFGDVNVVFLTLAGAFYYVPIWQNGPAIGSGSVSEAGSYATHSQDTGWWCVTQGNYLGALTATSFLTPDFNPSAVQYNPGQFTWNLQGLGTTSASVTSGTQTWNPSVAFEVAENAGGNIFVDNPNFDAEANVGGSAVYYYGITTTNHFLIGHDAPPATAFGSGVKFTPGSGSAQYYDELGSSAGTTGWLSSNWYITNPTNTQVGGTNLPALNSEGQSYLTMTAGTGGSASPGSGYYDNNEPLQISATPNSGYRFSSWSGTGTGSYTGSANPHTITIGGAIQETANFIRVYSVTFVTSPSADGTVSPTGTHSYDSGTVVSITATPNSGYSFSSWSAPSGLTVACSSCASTTVTVGATGTVTANFKVTGTYTLTMSATGPRGTILTPSVGTHTYAVGTQVTISANGNKFCYWTGTGAGSYSGSTDQVTITINNNVGETAYMVSSLQGCPNGPQSPSAPLSTMPILSLVSLLAFYPSKTGSTKDSKWNIAQM